MTEEQLEGAGRHILVVDGDAAARRVLEMALGKRGYEVTTARNGAEALRLIDRDRFDCVVAETDLPELDGFGLLAEMLRHPTAAATPVVFVSSDTSPGSKIKAFELGADEYITKPCVVDELYARLAAVVRRSELGRSGLAAPDGRQEATWGFGDEEAEYRALEADEPPPDDAAEQAATRVFVSYRRRDTPFAADSVYHALVERFGDGNVFKDIDTIQPGTDFGDVLTDWLDRCDVFLPLIGEHWFERDASGHRRIDDPGDFVRAEVELALGRGIPVIPITAGETEVPDPGVLPEAIRKLSRRQACRLRPGRDLGRDLEGIVKAVEKAASEARERARAARIARRRARAPRAGGAAGGRARGIAGDLSTTAPPEAIQMLASQNKTGVILLDTPFGRGEVFLEKGGITHAEFAGISGEEAVHLLFAIDEGAFRFRPGPTAQRKTVQRRTDAIILKGYQRMEETRAILQARDERLRGQGSA